MFVSYFAVHRTSLKYRYVLQESTSIPLFYTMDTSENLTLKFGVHGILQFGLTGFCQSEQLRCGVGGVHCQVSSHDHIIPRYFPHVFTNVS